jgi:hypothetical protein
VPNDTNAASDVFVRATTTAVTSLVSVARNNAPADGSSAGAEISPDGTRVAFDSYATKAHGQGAVGGSAPAISADGYELVFTSASASIAPHDTNNAADLFMVSSRDPNCVAIGTGLFECDITVAGALEPTTVRWFVDEVHLPSLDNLTVVGFQVSCQPATFGHTRAVVVGATDVAGLRGAYWCPP